MLSKMLLIIFDLTKRLLIVAYLIQDHRQAVSLLSLSLLPLLLLLLLRLYCLLTRRKKEETEKNITMETNKQKKETNLMFASWKSD